MLASSRRTLSRLREVGPANAARAARRRATRAVHARVREQRLRRRPLRVGSRELDSALGGLSLADTLRGPVLEALPTVAAWERSLSGLSEAERDDLVARADAVAAHRFELLGSGPVDLGREIDWSRDFKSGRVWPRHHIGRLRHFYYDDSDVTLPWELSRFQHLPLLAAAFRATGERRYLDEIGAQIESWIAANPVEIGVTWLCTMDVAIRGANWVAALALAAPEVAGERWGRAAAENLLLHGRFIRSHLETADKRGNHYLSDVAGLLVVAALFARGPEGAAWADWATRELVAEMEHQVRADGCDHEASLPYHRLVCELFVCGTQAADALRPGALPDWYRERLDRMLAFVRDYTRPDGLAPQLGDVDDGRFLPLDDYARADLRSHLHLFEQAGRTYEPATASAAYPDGGYWIMRGGDLYLLVRCGDTGIYGEGGHAHNDQLSFELALGEQPMVIDPGVYTYYTGEEQRLELRSTASHATLRVDGAEQTPLPAYPRFPMGDRSRAEAIDWSDTTFAGRHHGFEELPSPATHERRFALDPATRTVTIEDAVVSDGAHDVEWTFPLASCEVEADGRRAVADFGDATLTIECDSAELAVEAGWYCRSYGIRERTPYLRARKRSAPGRDVTTFTLRAQAATSE